MTSSLSAAERLGVPPRVVGGVLLGTLLNPLNSSMIAVALVGIQREFDVSVATSTWVVSGFYLSAAVGQPLMGRLVDLLGPRRLFIIGLFVTLLICSVAPFAPSFWWLVAVRAVQGLGTAAAYPSALVTFRQAADPDKPPPSGAIAVLGVVAGTSAAIGPVLGGVLVAIAGWQAIFLVNVPLTIAGIVIALRVLPRSSTDVPTPRLRQVLADVDIPGIVLFTVTITALLMFVLSIAESPRWVFAPIAILAGAALMWWSLNARSPFLDVRGLIANRPLASLMFQQGATNLAFYSIFFGLPIWLESVRGVAVENVGLLMLPLTAIGLVVTPLAASWLRRRGVRPALLLGSAIVVCTTLLLQGITVPTPLVLLILLITMLGIPNGINNLALQTGMYAAAPSGRVGASGGLFQTFRYLGAILASSSIGVFLERDLSTSGFHNVGWVATGAAIIMVTLAILLPRSLGRSPEHLERDSR